MPEIYSFQWLSFCQEGRIRLSDGDAHAEDEKADEKTFER